MRGAFKSAGPISAAYGVPDNSELYATHRASAVPRLDLSNLRDRFIDLLGGGQHLDLCTYRFPRVL